MKTDQAHKIFTEVQEFYRAIPSPKYRHVDIKTFQAKFYQLENLKDDLGREKAYLKLINAMSQIIAKLEKYNALANMPKGKVWSNLSERAMNKVIPPVLKRKGQGLPVEWTDKWGNTCSISNGYWGIKNYTVMDVIAHMFLLKEGSDCLPKNTTPIFNDLFEIQQRESLLNSGHGNITLTSNKHYIRFTDDDFRKFTGFQMSSAEIKDLLLETSRVEFKLTFPVRLKSTGSKENTHRMSYYSRFFELGYENINAKSNGVVLARRYTIIFNTLLGELTVNNLLAKFNDRIDIRFYLLPDSAQYFYRRGLINNNFGNIEFNLTTIAEYAGLNDSNPWNLTTTVETNILKPLIEYGYIDSYEKVGSDPKTSKFIIRRSGPGIIGKSRDEAGSVKPDY
jgi:hypothetical protein